MARYEKKKNEGINLAELLGILGVDDEIEAVEDKDEDEEHDDRVRALLLLRHLLDNTSDDGDGAVIEYRSGKCCPEGGEVVKVQGMGPYVLFGAISIIASVTNKFSEGIRDDLTKDMFNASKILAEFKRSKGMM